MFRTVLVLIQHYNNEDEVYVDQITLNNIPCERTIRFHFSRRGESNLVRGLLKREFKNAQTKLQELQTQHPGIPRTTPVVGCLSEYERDYVKRVKNKDLQSETTHHDDFWKSFGDQIQWELKHLLQPSRIKDMKYFYDILPEMDVQVVVRYMSLYLSNNRNVCL
ncbi:hypothetical protein AVEN_38387-1 [Araneus ventricosus]|uniref:Uncharacterized protein n=1 Tax=Araneus ventricosus TaxID=182803 RepID=A0A4Y2SNK8_ARAVE|nr:hypothetical protein AVEN_38387-1 [Araneus ventricosus]